MVFGLFLYAIPHIIAWLFSVQGDSVLKSLPLLVFSYVAALGVAVKDVHAQDVIDPPLSAPVAQTPDEDIQSTDDVSLNALNDMLPAHLRTPLPVGNAKNAPRTIPDVTDENTKTTPATRIEQFYRDISGDSSIAQFGYDFLNTPSINAASMTPTVGEVQDNYVLGVGDRLNIAFLGERKDHETYAIDRSGTLNIDLMPPVAAAGKTLGALRADIQRMMQAQSYHGDIYISLEHVRQIGVLVAGYVKQPGRHSLSPLQTVLEALVQSGGATSDGSLRQIRLIRDGTSTPIDLYAVMNGHDTSTLPTLQDGDRIIVPPLGATIAVTGDVRKPAIYELPQSGRMDSALAVEMAGGFLSAGQNRMVMMSPKGNGSRVAQPVSSGTPVNLSDGTILAVNRTLDRSAGSFQLSGETRSPGTFALSQYKKLSALLRSSQAFGDDVYPLLGVITRRRDAELTQDLVAFSPQDVFAGRGDMTLQDGDDVRLLSHDAVQSIITKKPTEDVPPLVATFVREHMVSLQGAVRLPGSWPVAGPVPVARLLNVAGGALTDADLSRVEINRNNVGFTPVSSGAVSHRDTVNLSHENANAITVTSGDAVRIPDRFEAVTRQSVTLKGEVKNPGTYDLMRGDTLLTLIDRAGGLTDQAYSPGTVFSRASERKREKEKYNIAAHDLERSIAMAADTKDGKVNMEQMAMAKELVDEMKTIDPVGRITVQADPGVLRDDPAQDILLETGDVVYVPKRPLTVRVTGEVMNPVNLQFRADKTSRDYLAEAGGVTMHADNSRAFILFPDGSAQPLRSTKFASFRPLMIVPGSTIIVPRDPKPFDFIESAKDISQILSNIAITGLYADDLLDRGN